MLTKAEYEFIKKNLSSGEAEGDFPCWVAIPHMPGRKPWTTDEITEYFKIRNGEKDHEG